MNRRSPLPRRHPPGTTRADCPSRPQGCRCLTAASCSSSRLPSRQRGNGGADLGILASLLIEDRLGGEAKNGWTLKATSDQFTSVRCAFPTWARRAPPVPIASGTRQTPAPLIILTILIISSGTPILTPCTCEVMLPGWDRHSVLVVAPHCCVQK